MKFTKEELRKIAADARRDIDLQEGIGLNRHKNISVDEKKKRSKNKCRNKITEEE